MTKRVATFITSASAFSLICDLHHQLLVVLLYADDKILTVENLIESLFPPSKRIFNKIDGLADMAESLPGKFDDVINKFPVIINQVPVLDWTLAYLISWLNFLLSTLTRWDASNTREKEITIDINYENLNNQSQSPENVYFPPESINISKNNLPDETEKVQESSTCAQFEEVKSSLKPDAMSCSYKEVLEKGTKESVDDTEDFITHEKEIPKSNMSAEEIPKSSLTAEEILKSNASGEEVSKPTLNAEEIPKYTVSTESDVMKCTYKEILEKGAKESVVEKEDSIAHEIPKSTLDVGEIPKSNVTSEEIPVTILTGEENPKSKMSDEVIQNSTLNVEEENPNFNVSTESDVMKCSYKEVLEKGAKERIEEKEDSIVHEIPKSTLGVGEIPKSSESAEEIPKSTLTNEEIPNSNVSAEVPKHNTSAEGIPESNVNVEDVAKYNVSMKEIPKSISSAEEIPESNVSAKEGGESGDMDTEKGKKDDLEPHEDDPILQLFETSWHRTSPGRW